MNADIPNPCCNYVGVTLDTGTVHVELSNRKPDGSVRVMITTNVHCPQCKTQFVKRLVVVTKPDLVDDIVAKDFAIYDAEELLRIKS